VIHNALHQIELIAFFVTLGIHIFSDHVYSVLTTAAIRELNLAIPCVQHGIGIGNGTPFNSPTKCTLYRMAFPVLSLSPIGTIT
jgi:hypothetical protein